MIFIYSSCGILLEICIGHLSHKVLFYYGKKALFDSKTKEEVLFLFIKQALLNCLTLIILKTNIFELNTNRKKTKIP